MTLGAGFHHYRVMVLDLEPRQQGEESGEAEWVVGDARREKEAAGASRELHCSLDATCHTVGSQARCLPVLGLSHQHRSWCCPYGSLPVNVGKVSVQFLQLWLFVGDRDPLPWMPELKVEL